MFLPAWSWREGRDYFARLAFPIGFKVGVFSPITKWTIKKEIG